MYSYLYYHKIVLSAQSATKIPMKNQEVLSLVCIGTFCMKEEILWKYLIHFLCIDKMYSSTCHPQLYLSAIYRVYPICTLGYTEQKLIFRVNETSGKKIN